MDIVALVLSVTGIILNAKKNWLCWLFWLSSNALWVLYFIPKGEWTTVALWSLYSLFNVYGLYSWIKDDTLSNIRHD